MAEALDRCWKPRERRAHGVGLAREKLGRSLGFARALLDERAGADSRKSRSREALNAGLDGGRLRELLEQEGGFDRERECAGCVETLARPHAVDTRRGDRRDRRAPCALLGQTCGFHRTLEFAQAFRRSACAGRRHGVYCDRECRCAASRCPVGMLRRIEPAARERCGFHRRPRTTERSVAQHREHARVARAEDPRLCIAPRFGARNAAKDAAMVGDSAHRLVDEPARDEGSRFERKRACELERCRRDAPRFEGKSLERRGVVRKVGAKNLARQE